jgi:beta-fructofuranosidase
MGESTVRNELGVMTLPRLLSLHPNGQLRIEPPEEFKTLRQNHRNQESLIIHPRQDRILCNNLGGELEIDVKTAVPQGSVFGLRVLMSPDGREQTAIDVDTAAHTLSIDTTRSSLRTDIYQPYPLMQVKSRSDIRIQVAPFTLIPDEPLHLRVFVDRSILEVFANGRQCVTQRVYPAREESLQIALFSETEPIHVLSIDVWDVAATNLESM